VAELFAGWVIGYALALLLAPAAAIALVRSSARGGFAQRLAPPGTSAIALAVVLHLGAVLVLTAIGLVLGMVLAGLEDRRPDGGLGSPNVVYTLIVLALAAVVVIPVLVVPAVRRPAIAAAVVFAVLFGWAMPWLARAGD
jgi:hypothetical protein